MRTQKFTTSQPFYQLFSIEPFPDRPMTMLRNCLLFLVACLAVLGHVQAMPEPQYHIRPPEHWINDPNGPYRDSVNGKIHLYMQYNPWGALWGNMSWYHVTSDDYVKWRHEPVAMYNDLWYNHWGVYSGGMCDNNYSTPVVVYTCVEDVNLQRQCLANPTKADLEGRRLFNEFVQSPLNPILGEDDVPGIYSLENFRDPTDWWQDPADPNKWLIAFSVRATTEKDGDSAHVVVFSTADPSFQSGYEFSHFMYTYKYDPDNMFECPDFFKLDDYSEHFLKLSTMPPHRDYFVYGSYELNNATGKYDFVEDTERTFTWADFGPYYASKSFNDPILNRRLYWGWLQEELTNDQILEQGWSGVQTLMRDIEYDTVEKKLRLFPAGELKALRLQKILSKTDLAVTSTPLELIAANTTATRFHEIVAKFKLSDATPFNGEKYYTDSTAPEFGVMIRANKDLSKYTTISVRMPAATASPVANVVQDTTYSILKNWTVESESVCQSECKRERTCETWSYISGTKECHLYWKSSERVAQTGTSSGTVNEPWFYMGRASSGTIGYTDPLHGRAPLTQSHPNEVELHIFVDDSVIEAFKDGGLESISGHTYLPDSPEQTGIAVYAKNMGTVTADVTIYTMDDIWAAPEPPSVVTNFTNSLNDLLTTLVE